MTNEITTKHTNKVLLGITIAYAFVLLAVLGIWGYTPTNDGDGYIEFAQVCIAQKQPYPCTALIVGQPFIWNVGAINLVALSLWAFGSLGPLLVLMCLLKALTAWLVGKVAQRLLNNKVAIVAALLYVFYPNNWGQSTTILSEVPMIALALLGFYWAIAQQKLRWCIAAGAVMGLANWFRPVAPVFLGTLLLYYLLFARERWITKAAGLCGGFALFVAAVGFSCYMRTGHFVYQAETLWFNMAEATYEPSVAPQYDTDPYPKGTIRYIEGREHLTTMQCNEIWKERSVAWLKAHPWQYLQKVPLRLMYMWYNDMDNLSAFYFDKQNGQNRYVLLPYRNLWRELPNLSGVQRLALLNGVYYIVLLIGAMVGSVLLIKRKNFKAAFMPLMIIVGGSLSLVLAIHGETRFKAPFMPFVFVLAAVAIATICNVTIRNKPYCYIKKSREIIREIFYRDVLKIN